MYCKLPTNGKQLPAFPLKAQTSGFDPGLKSKHVLTARCLMSLIGLLASTEKNGSGGMPSHEALSVSSQGALEISSVAGQPPSLDKSHCSTLRLVAKSLKPDERCKPSTQRPHYPTLYRRLRRRLGHSLRSKFYQGSVVRPGKKATHKRPRIEGGLPGPSKLQGPLPEPNSASCNGQLNSGSLHKQTRRNSLCRDVCSPVEDHDLVPSLSHNIESQTHSRVPECDSRPSVQVEPSAVNRMVTASAGVQTDLPKVAHSSCRLICHSSEPQTSTVCISGPRPKGVGHRCSEHKLDGSHCLCLPSDGSPSQGDKKMDSSKNKASLSRWQREFAAPQRSTRTIYRSKWALFEKWCRENSVDFSTPTVKQVSDFFMYLYQDLNRCPSTIDGYRTAIVDTVGPPYCTKFRPS